MLKMIQKRLAIELTDNDATLIQQNLQSRFNSLFYRIRLEYLSRLGLELDSYGLTTPPADSNLLIGELFMPEPGVICFLKGMRGNGYIEAGAITSNADYPLDDFFADVRDAISEVVVCQNNWQTSEEFQPLIVEGADPNVATVQPNEMAAARCLMDTTSRALLEKIKDAGSIFLNKICTENRQDTEARIRSFEDLKLINKEYAVLCRRTGQQILRVADRSTIDESSQKSFKCFICGNPIAEEVVEEIATSNELCSDMFKDNKWLLVFVQGILAELGVTSEAISVYRAPNLPTRLFLCLNGQRYLIVLCTEPLNLDQANLIGAHITAYGLSQAIIIATQNISTLMRHHLAKANENTKFHFISELNNLDAALEKIFVDRQREYVKEQLDVISVATKVNIPKLVLSRMMPKVEEPEPAPEPASTPEPFAAPEVANDAALEEAALAAANLGEASGDEVSDDTTEESKGKKKKNKK